MSTWVDRFREYLGALRRSGARGEYFLTPSEVVAAEGLLGNMAICSRTWNHYNEVYPTSEAEPDEGNTLDYYRFHNSTRMSAAHDYAFWVKEREPKLFDAEEADAIDIAHAWGRAKKIYDLEVANASFEETMVRSRSKSSEERADAAPSAKVARKPLITLSAVELDQMQPPRPLIEPLLYLDTLAVLYGPSGAGKSFVALDWSLSVAAGVAWPWRPDRPNRHEPKPVLYVAAEGVAGLKDRTAAWCDHREIDVRDVMIQFVPKAVLLGDHRDVAELAAKVETLKPALIVIDTFARCSAGLEENSASDMGRAIDSLDRFRQASSGACVLAIHHSGKDASAGARGSSALRAAVDTEIENTCAGDRITLTTRKQKEAPEAAAIRIDRIPHLQSAVLVAASSQREQGGISQAALSALEALRRIQVPGGIGVSDWFPAAGVSRSTLYELRRDLLDGGLIKNVATGKRDMYVTSDFGSD